MKRAPWNRTAFTLVEVLIVIAIIGMLAGLGTAAVRRALAAARRAAIFIEIDQLSQALNAYKERTREYPPAFADTSANGEGDYSVKKRFIQHLLFAFPGYNPEPDPGNNGDLIEQQYSTIQKEILANYKVELKNGQQFFLDLDKLVLNGNNNSQAEALAFWLGGMPTPLDIGTGGDGKRISSRPLAGFNVDGQNPFRFQVSYPTGATSSDRRDMWLSKRTPQLFAFDVTRFTDTDGDGWPEYYPELGLGGGDDFKVPYVYFDYRSYVRAGAGANAQSPTAPINQPGYRAFIWYNSARTAIDSVVPYARATGSTGVNFANGSDIEWMGDRSFQILCCGLDGAFSDTAQRTFSLLPTARAGAAYPGGAYSTNNAAPKSGLATADTDNLTSFSSSQVGDVLVP